MAAENLTESPQEPKFWRPRTLEHFNSLNVEECSGWMGQGLTEWPGRGGRLIHKTPAFFPLHNMFDPGENPEEQLAELFHDLPIERARKKFTKALSLSFSQCEPTPKGWSLFDSLQYVTGLSKRPEPLPAMIERLCDPAFLDPAEENTAQHLYAGGFLVIEDVPPGRETVNHIARLMRHKRFQQDYIPGVARILARK